MHTILISDTVDPAGLELLAASGAEVHKLTDAERPRLAEILPDYDALVVRSMTKVTADLLRAGKRLKVVGRAGIGVDNVDVAAATDLGILVVNAPTANLLSATEHTFALLLATGAQRAGRRRPHEVRQVGPQEIRGRRAPGQDPGGDRLRPHRPEGGGARPRTSR